VHLDQLVADALAAGVILAETGELAEKLTSVGTVV